MKRGSTIVLLFCVINGVIMAQQIKEAYFAGGCFWCMEPPFEMLEGVEEVISGFSGGEEINPSYEDVAYGKTTHLEAIKVIYDANRISYQELLHVFWRQIDPTDAGGQFVDRGAHYATAIFHTTQEEKRLIEQSKQDLERSGWFDKPIVTAIRPFTHFYPAEQYHQDYYKTNSLRYKFYRKGSGRDYFLRSTWGTVEDSTAPIEEKQ